MGSIAPQLARRQKAAIIIRLLAANGAKLPLAGLPDQAQEDLATEIGRMRAVDRDTVNSVVEEFTSAVEAIGLSFPDGLEGALSMLDGQLSAHAASRLRRLVGDTAKADPWQRITAVDPGRLLAVVENESAEVGAILLSKLAIAKAAELLGKLPGDKARRIAYAVSQTGGVSRETVRRIGHALAVQFDVVPQTAFDSDPVERVGAILNYSTAGTREDVLKGLDEEDRAFADEVRKAIFTFTNIPVRIDARDIPKVIRAVDQAKLIAAIAGARGEDLKTVEFILANISQRMAASLREEAEALGKVKDKDAEAAMATVVAAIRELEAAGEIFLIAGEEEEA